jgi:hypothetical protein
MSSAINYHPITMAAFDATKTIMSCSHLNLYIKRFGVNDGMCRFLFTTKLSLGYNE